MRKLLFILFLIIHSTLHAQLDTNFVADYKARLVVSVYQALRSHELDITQTSVADTNAFSSLTRLSYSSEKLQLRDMGKR